MSLSNKKAIGYLINQFHYYLLIEFIKMLGMLKCQQFKDNASDKMESSISKYHMHDNEEEQSLDKYESEDKGKRYILFSFITPLSTLQRESNRLTNLGEGIKSLNHLVCILKICYLEKC